MMSLTPHTPRHTHIVHNILEHVPIAAVQAQVGHKKLATTQTYSKLAPGQVKEAYERKQGESTQVPLPSDYTVLSHFGVFGHVWK